MKKKYVVIFSVLLIVSVLIYICIPKEKEEVEDAETKANKNGFLTLMLEQDDGSYQKSTSNTWRGDGYAFNNELSGCERGGELVYDRETNIVKLISSGSDKCYVYFDKYNVAKITNVTNTKTTNSVTLTVTTQAGENPIDKYYFSSDGGNSYVESTSPNYTFSNLTPNTTYTFKVYAKDTQGYESNEESIQVTTDNYVNPTVNSVTVTGTTTSSITVSVNASGGTNDIQRYYYSSNGGSSYANTTSNSYTFSGLSAGQTYQIRVYVVDSNGIQSNVYNLTVQTDDTVLLADYVKGLYTSQGANGLYYHTSSLANSAADNSYRYAGANPNNYVCFGSNASTCPSDNLYRIIGVFGNQVKLIKSTSYGSYKWNSSENNTWSSSTLNAGTLNGTYLSGLSSTWQNKIATTNWKVGGMAWSTTNTAKQYYNVEVGSSSSSTTYSAKIGLMYVSDYGFAASPDYWTTELFNYEPSKSSNWMNINLNEWTISRSSDNTNRAFYVYSAGCVDGVILVYLNSRGVRPVFYLTSSTGYVSGSGTSSDPIRIN